MIPIESSKSFWAMRSLQAALVYTLMVLFFIPPRTNAQVVGVGGKRDLTVMTRNLYIGAGFGSLLSLDPADPDYPQRLVAAVTGVYYTAIVQNNFNMRVPGIVDEIVDNLPDLVGVQEATVVRVQSPGDIVIGGSVPATAIVMDQLQLLIDALADRGAHYAVVSRVQNLEVELPFMNLMTGGIDDVRVTDQDVILARTDLPPGYLRLRNPMGGNYQYSIGIPSIGLSFTRGWCSVDAEVRGRSFRFVNTHLEEEIAPEVQWLQAQELLAGPANTALPVILVGDLNTDGNRQNGTVTYDGLLSAGFVDSWDVVHPGEAGLTWGHDSFLADPTMAFVWRIDLILFRGGKFRPVDSEVLDAALQRDNPPFWSSDHAGVVSRFLVK